MSVQEKVINESLPQDSGSSSNKNVLDSLFSERDSIKTDSVPEKKPKTEEKSLNEIKNVNKDSSEDKKEKSEEKSKVNKSPLSDDEDGDDNSNNVEIEKLKKALSDSKKWGHTNNKRLKSVTKIINSLKDAGALTDDEFGNLNELLQSDPDEDEIHSPKISNNPLDRLVEIANKRVDDLAEIYEDDPLFKKKIESFDLFIANCSQEEKDEIQEELETLEKTPFKLVKRMFQIGEKYYDEEYKEIEEAGGFKNLLSSKNSVIEKMQKKLDKLERKLASYDDYDHKPTNRIDELGDAVNVTTNRPGDTFGQLLEERDRKRG